MPPVLHPWISRALDAYAEQTHIKGTIRATATAEKREQAVRLIVDLMSYEGMSKDKAIEQVAQMTGYTVGTLLEYYKDAAELRRELWEYAQSHPVESFSGQIGLDPGTTGTHTRKRARLEPLGGKKKRRRVP